MTKMHTVKVALDDRSYDIMVGKGVAAHVPDFLLRRSARRVFVVTDTQVDKLPYASKFLAALQEAGLKVEKIVVPAGEQAKSFAEYEKLVNHLLSHAIERGDIVLALGGGVVGDLTGFCAATVLRGIDFIQVPTTLLAMVDSSVGGKTGINTKAGKNLVGAFYQPIAVYADTAFLESLPRRHFLAGYAEVVKYGLIDDAPFFAALEKSGGENIEQAIVHSCEAKARIVSEDEREAGKRALLNLGHTFGHALEGMTGYSDTLLHGEGVAIGMVLAFRFSEFLGLCSAADTARVEAHLRAVGLPVAIREVVPDFSAAQMLEFMRSDKKVSSGKLTFILVKGIGKAFVQKGVEEAKLLKFLKEIA